MLSVPMEGSQVGHSPKIVGKVRRTYGQANIAIVLKYFTSLNTITHAHKLHDNAYTDRTTSLYCETAKYLFQNDTKDMMENGNPDVKENNNLKMTPLDRPVAQTKAAQYHGRAVKQPIRHNDRNIITGYLRRILDVLKENQQESQQNSLSSRRRSEWMLLAYVVDRVLLVMFVTLCISLGLLILFQYAYNPQSVPNLLETKQMYS